MDILENGEPVFTLRAQDRSSCQLVQLWISLNHDAPVEKLLEASKTLEAMRKWPHKKKAD